MLGIKKVYKEFEETIEREKRFSDVLNIAKKYLKENKLNYSSLSAEERIGEILAIEAAIKSSRMYSKVELEYSLVTRKLTSEKVYLI